MELTQLRTLIQVAELGSLSRAAERLRIAQPALSRQIRLLEAELGARLFERHGRGMMITDQGRDAVAHAIRVLAEVDELRAGAVEGSAPLTGCVAIGLPPTVADVVSVPLVAAFQATHPRAAVRLVSAYTGYLLDWLRRGDIDVAVHHLTKETAALRSRPLLRESLFLIGPPAAGLSTVRAVPFSALANERLLLPSLQHGLREIVERFAEQAGIALSVAVEADSYATLTDLVRHGHGRTILPLAPVHDDVRAGRLTAAPLIDPVPTRQVVLSFAPGRPTPRLARFAGDTITSIVTSRVERGDWPAQLLTH
jgi:LysR family transcriptional regulator, nitrogen assimilation regulatory protein